MKINDLFKRFEYIVVFFLTFNSLKLSFFVSLNFWLLFASITQLLTSAAFCCTCDRRLSKRSSRWQHCAIRCSAPVRQCSTEVIMRLPVQSSLFVLLSSLFAELQQCLHFIQQWFTDTHTHTLGFGYKRRDSVTIPAHDYMYPSSSSE